MFNTVFYTDICVSSAGGVIQLFVSPSLTLTNKFDAPQEKTETHTLNDEYENFVNAHLEAAAECIPTKRRGKLSLVGDISS